MSILPILTYPDMRLKKVCRPVVDGGDLDLDTRKLIEDLFETMYDAPGIGLAAPQVGGLVRVVVVDVSGHQEASEPLALVNPEIIRREGEILWEEGCLSVPELLVDMPRSECITIKGLDVHGKSIELEAHGLLAIALQHELDHLNGHLIIDRVSRLKRELYRKQRIKTADQSGG
jgi:peptide deformylase